MLAFFQSIGDFLQSVFAFLDNFIESIFEMFKWMGKALLYVADLSPYIPPSLLGIALVFITVSVVYLIVGR